jgi:hypothetical protein
MAKRRRRKSSQPETPLKPELEISNIPELESLGTSAPGILDAPESVTQYKTPTSYLPMEEEEEDYSSRLDIQFPKRRSVYYSITEAEVNMYAQLGWISTVCLTLFGAFIGLAFGCFVGTIQDNIPIIARSVLTSIMWVTGFVSLIFFIISIVFIVLQSRSKKEWEPEPYD